MADDQAFPFELLPGHRSRITMSDEDALYFAEWQKLSGEQKAALPWMARNKTAFEVVVRHQEAFRMMAAAYYYVVQTGQILLKLGALAVAAAACIGIAKMLGWS